VYRLPVSGIAVTLRQPAGAEDLLLYEAADFDIALALALIGRLASPEADWGNLCVTDIEILLLLLRQSVLGDLIQAEALCTSRDCGARVDLSFRVNRYLAHHRPRAPRHVEREGATGWFRFTDRSLRFRLPVAADLVAVSDSPEPESALLQRCVDPAHVPSRVRARVERAMEALAPSLSHQVEGQCPQCRSAIAFYFDVQAFVLRELRNRAATVYRDIHLLASQYNWREEDILALPRGRRAQFAAMIADGGIG
jgi:hypothetical protein